MNRVSALATTVHPIADLSRSGTVHLRFHLPYVPGKLNGLLSLDTRLKFKQGVLAGPNGKQVLTNQPVVSVSHIWPQLVDEGFSLYDSYKEDGRVKGIVVTLVFCRESARAEGEDSPFILPDFALRSVNEITKSVWKYAHVWLNPDGSSSIILIEPNYHVDRAGSDLVIAEGRLVLASGYGFQSGKRSRQKH